RSNQTGNFELIVNGSIPLGSPCAYVSEILTKSSNSSCVYSLSAKLNNAFVIAVATDALDPNPLPGGIDDLIFINKSLRGKFKCLNVSFIQLTIPSNEAGADSIGP